MLTRLRSTSGFTILELMIALLIIAVLLALGLAKFAPAVNAAKEMDARASVRAALVDASAFYSVNESYSGISAADITSPARTTEALTVEQIDAAGGCTAEATAAAAGSDPGKGYICGSTTHFRVAACSHSGVLVVGTLSEETAEVTRVGSSAGSNSCPPA